MTDNVNIQILEALGYWDAGPVGSARMARGWLVQRNANRFFYERYTDTQLESAAQYAIKNRLNMEGDR